MRAEDILDKVERLELESKDFGFYWTEISQIMEQIRSECTEIEEAHKNNDMEHLQEEIGDLLLAALSLTIFCQMSPHETLRKSADKYEKRFNKLKELAQKDGRLDLCGEPMKTLLNYWKAAKKL